MPGLVVGSEAQIFIHAVGIHNFAGVHLPIRVPDPLEFAKGLNEFRAKHAIEQFGARLAVAVLSGNGSAVAHHQVGGFFHKPAKFGNTSGRLQIEVHAIVNATIPEVPVQCAAIVERLHHPQQIAQVSPKFLRSDRGIFPALPGQRFTGDMRDHAQA